MLKIRSMISIIVPVWNSAQYIRRCISSVLNQTYKDWELILVNDGSVDDSEEIIRSYLEDDRIKLYSKENGGVSSARNYGIENSTGEYLLFLDSDDWLAENTCEELMSVILQKSTDCVVFGFSQTHGKIWAPEYDIDYMSLSDLKNDFDYWLNTELLSSSVNKIYRRSLVDSYFPVDMSFGEDLVFSLIYISHCNRISFIKTPLYQHEVYNTQSLTHSFDINRFVDVERIQNTILNFANVVTVETFHKYFLDVQRLVRMFFHYKSIPFMLKMHILDDWRRRSYYRTIDLKQYNLSLIGYIYARFIQLGNWKLLMALHRVKCVIDKMR